jgi:hypothetical protein
MKGGVNMKKTVTFTVEESVLNTFNQFAEVAALNKSKWIEQQMIRFTEVNKNYE